MGTYIRKEKIGKVRLNYTFYSGKDTYTDGTVEDVLLEACKDGTDEHLLRTSNDWAVLYHLSAIRENLIEWYPFTKEDKVLEIGAGCGAITGILSEKTGAVTCIELSEKRSMINAYRNKEKENIEIYIGNFQNIEPHMEKFDYVTLIGVWEYSGLYIEGENPYLEMLAIAQKHLKPDGKLIIAIENKMGLKYWNGAAEDHTGNLYSGLNDYINDNTCQVRTFSKMEIEELFHEAGIEKYSFYYPMPDYKLPNVIYHNETLPEPGRERNFGKDYSAARVYNFNDAAVTDQLCADGMFPYFANSFLIIAGSGTERLIYAKYNRLRKKAFQIKTEIWKTENTWLVKKSPLNKAAQKHISQLRNNEMKWIENPLRVRQFVGEIQEGKHIAPYIEGTDLDATFYKYRYNIKKFTKQFLLYKDTYFTIDKKCLMPFYITDEFVTIFGGQAPTEKGSLKFTNVDMIFSNLRLTSGGELYCIDCEWVFDFPVPYEFIIWRSAMCLYLEFKAYLKNQITAEKFLVKIGIPKENIPVYENMEKNFQNYVYGETANYLENYRKKIILQSIKIL